jgi:PAS domain-containing protein
VWRTGVGWRTEADQIESRYAWIARTPDPVVITDAEGRVLAANDAFGRLFSSGSELRPYEDPVEDLIIASRYRAAYRAARRRALAAGPAVSAGPAVAAGPAGGFVAVRRDAGEFPVNLTLATTSEDPTHVATWVRDLTDDRRIIDPHTDARDSVRASGGAGWIRELGMDCWSDAVVRQSVSDLWTAAG